MIREFTDVVVDAAEAKRVSSLTGAAREGGLPENTIKRIEKDSHYPAPAKTSLQIALPRLTAKYLNKAGISAEYADEAALLTSLGAILVQGRKLQATLDELIETNRKLQNERTNRTNQNSQAPPSPGNSTL